MHTSDVYNVQHLSLYQKRKSSIKINEVAGLYDKRKTTSSLQLKKRGLNAVFIHYPIRFRYNTRTKHSYVVWCEGEIKNREFRFIKSKPHSLHFPETLLRNNSFKHHWKVASDKLYYKGSLWVMRITPPPLPPILSTK